MTYFLTIQETARLTGLSTHTLRYYERIGLLDPVTRRDNSHRLFSEQDIQWIQFLLKLKTTGLPVRDMVSYADLRRQGNTMESVSARKALLEQHTYNVQRTIAELQDNLQILQTKLALYGEMMQQAAPSNDVQPTIKDSPHDISDTQSSSATAATPAR